MRSLQFTEAQLAAHEARIAKFRAEGRVRTVVDGRNEAKRIPAPKKIEGSPLERMMMMQILAEKLPPPERQYLPFDGRKFRLDFSWPDRKVVLECDGHVHRIKERFHADIERHNLLLLAGWKVLRAGREEIESGRAMAWLKQLLEVV